MIGGICLPLVCPVLSVSLDCLFFSAPSVFSNVYLLVFSMSRTCDYFHVDITYYLNSTRGREILFFIIEIIYRGTSGG
jgi:hypothetical protein